MGGDGSVGAPYRTLAKAAAEATHGKLIRLRAGVWRETLPLNGKGNGVGRITVARYGTERAVVSGFEVATGWEPCTLEDAAIVGAVYPNVYKLNMAKTLFASGNPVTGNLHEAGKRMPPASVKSLFPIKDWTDADTDEWLTSDETIVVAGKIIGYRHARTTSLYTEDQIKGATFNFHATANSHAQSTIAEVTDGVMILTDQTRNYETNEKKDRFALINMPAALTPGAWAYYDLGDGTVDVFVWPRNAANLTSSIEYSARGIGVDCRGTSAIELRGLVIEGQASAGSSNDMIYAVSAGNASGTTPREELIVTNCEIANTWRDGQGYSPIMLRSLNRAKITHNTIRNAVGQHAIFALGGNYNNSNIPMEETDVSWNYFYQVEKSATRHYGNWDAIIDNNLYVECGSSAHSNKTVSYEGCRRNLYIHNIFWGCGGYMTWQESSSIDLVQNFVPSTLHGSSRSIVDQNHHDGADASPASIDEVYEVSHILGNALVPSKSGLGAFNSINVGDAKDPYCLYAVHGNIVHGAHPTAEFITSWGDNLYTGGTTYGASDSTTTVGAVWTDLTKGDLTIKATAPNNSLTYDATDLIEDLKARYPRYEGFERDLAGVAFDPSEAPVGPLSPGSDLPALPPVWVERPVIGGALSPGETLTIEGGSCMVHPFVAPTRQWIRSDDQWVSWANISGATGETYEVQDEDAGWHLGVKSKVGDREVFSVTTAPVSDSYPLGNPDLVATQKYPGSGVNGSISNVPSTGKPLLLFVTMRLGTTADNTLTVTSDLGTFELFDRFRRAAGETQIWACYEPEVGTENITVTAASACQSILTQVIEVEGLTGIGARGTAGSTSVNTFTSSVTTTTPETLVLHMFLHYVGNVAGNEMTITGATTLVVDDSNNTTATSAITLGIAYERAEDPGVQQAVATWTTAAVSAWLAIELKGAS